MSENYYSEFNEHGVVTPIKDLSAFPRSEQAVLGASNQMPFPYYVASGYESQSVTYTYDDEGKVSASGTSTGDSTFFFFRQVPASQLYKFNGWFLKGLTGGTQGKVFLTLNQSTSPWTSYAQNIDGATKISGIPNDSTPVDCSFKIANGFSFSGVVKPQISLSADTPFAPYAKTNKELTDAVALIDDASKITFAEGVSSYGASYFSFDNVGNLNVISGLINGVVANADTWVTIGSIASGFRPKRTYFGFAGIVSTSEVVELQIYSDGNIALRRNGGAIVATNNIRIFAVYAS